MSNNPERYQKRRRSLKRKKKGKLFESFKMRDEIESKRKEVERAKKERLKKKELMRADVLFSDNVEEDY